MAISSNKSTPVKQDSAFEKTRRFLFGDDIFISYSRVDSTYALSLANELTKRKLSCYLDQWGTPPGEKLPEELINTIKKCSTMVLIGSKNAADSENVGLEVKEFLETTRPIIPITFVADEVITNVPEDFNKQNLTGTLEQSKWYSLIKGIAKTTEVSSALQTRTPSENVILRIVNSVEFRSRNKRLRKTFYTTLGAIIVLLALAGILFNQAIDAKNQAQNDANKATKLANDKTEEANKASVLANKESNRAKSETNRANDQANIASIKTEEANKATKLANEKDIIAQEKTKLASEKTKIAETAAKRADEQTHKANLAEERKAKAEGEAQKQELIAASRRLAVESKFASEKNSSTLNLGSYDPQRSVLLAIESLRLRQTPEGMQALHDAVMNLTDQAYSVEIDEEKGDLSISPNAKFLGIVQHDKSFLRSIKRNKFNDEESINTKQERFSDRQIPEQNVSKLLFSKDSKRFAAVTDDRIIIRDTESLRDLKFFLLPEQSEVAGLNADGSELKLKDENKSVTCEPESDCTPSENGEWIAKSNNLNSIRISNTKTGKVFSISPKFNELPEKIALSSDAKLLVAAWGNSVKIYNTKGWKEVATLPHEWNLREIKFSSDNQWLTTITSRVSMDVPVLGETILPGSVIRVWNLNNLQPVMNVSLAKEGGIIEYAFENDGKILISLTPVYSDYSEIELTDTGKLNKRKASIWILTPNDLISLGCNLISRNLSDSEWSEFIQKEVGQPRETCKGLSIPIE